MNKAMDKDINWITENFDEMSTSDLCIWLEHHKVYHAL